MFNRIFQRGAVATAMLILGSASASATIFSGDPFADGWLAGGRSTIVGPDLGFPNGAFAGALPGLQNGHIAEYRVYSRTTTAQSILVACEIQCQAWAENDVIVGLGAVFPNVTPDAGGGQGNPATIVVKWGVSASAYTLSNDYLSGGAHRNHEIGEGGAGSVLAELNFGSASGNVPTAAFQWTGTQNLTLGGGFIFFRSIVSSEYFRSFEAYLNVTQLNAANNSPLRLYDGNSIVGVRNYNMGSLIQETNALIAGTAVPEPATGLLAAGTLLAGWIVRRRRLNS